MPLGMAKKKKKIPRCTLCFLHNPHIPNPLKSAHEPPLSETTSWEVISVPPLTLDPSVLTERSERLPEISFCLVPRTMELRSHLPYRSFFFPPRPRSGPHSSLFPHFPLGNFFFFFFLLFFYKFCGYLFVDDTLQLSLQSSHFNGLLSGFIYSSFKYLTLNVFKIKSVEFSGDTVDKHPSTNAGDVGSIPGPGRVHVPRSN